MKYLHAYPSQIAQTMSVNNAYILSLCTDGEAGPQRYIPILIGENEAQAIIMAVENKQAKRPLTHNLLCNIMKEYLLTLGRVTIDRFDEGIFYSTLHISDGFSEKRIDCRTSDAIVLALLQEAEILIASDVVDETAAENMDRTFVSFEFLDAPKNEGSPEETIAALEALLHECEEKEDYERAQQIMEQIQEKLKGKN